MILPTAHRLGLSMYKVLLDSDKYLLSYSIFILRLYLYTSTGARCSSHEVTDFISFD